MNHRQYFSKRLVLVIIIACIVLASSVSAAELVKKVRPTVVAEFDEVVIITSDSLKNLGSGKLYNLITITTDNETYKFMPEKALQNGNYELAVTVTDLLGNPAEFMYNFEVRVDSTEIILDKPRLGVSNTTNFDIVILTNRESDCKYRSTLITDFDQPGLQIFEPDTDKTTHTSYNVSVNEDFPRDLFVVCLDSLGRENFAEFKLYADLTPPNIENIDFIPEPIVEYPMFGEIVSDMGPVASEDVICKYHNDSEVAYTGMFAFGTFDLYDFDAYVSTPSQTLEFPDNPLKKTYEFYVQCEDRAGWRTEHTKTDVLLDLTAALDFKVTTPEPASQNTEVFINITTNKRGFCTFKFGDTDYAAMSSSSTNPQRIHTAPVGVLTSGRYTISFYCFSDISGTPEELFKDYDFIIDQDPPSKTTINVTTPICDDVAEAKFQATDDLSGVDNYFWTFYTPTTILNNGTSGDTVTVSNDLNGDSITFNESDSYYFMAYAVDKAGNIGPTAQSSEMKFDGFGASCDTTPPIVTLIKNAAGDQVEMLCQDDRTGCMSYSWAYFSDASCNTSNFNYVFPPILIPFFTTTYICYEVADKAGNVAKGGRLFTKNISINEEGVPTCDEGIDNDKDGYGWGCLNGFDCDDTNSSIFLGCPSGCRQDTDGDWYGWGCLNGNDCNDNNANETTLCANGCISDNDGDETGLGCEKGPDCDGLDPAYQIECPNGCVSDNDGDNYGFGCQAGLDCNGENDMERSMCANGCVSDMDGDGYGLGCEPDCDGLDPFVFEDCQNGCLVDEDSDDRGLGCQDGLDCNGVNPAQVEGCPNDCLQDGDGDGLGPECIAGHDCNDLNQNLKTSCDSGCMEDTDGDELGLCCFAGSDCNDYTFLVLGNCTTNCSFDGDCDGMETSWESKYGLNIAADDSQDDFDEDSFTNLDEFCSNKDPTTKDDVYDQDKDKDNPDKDGDGVLDSCEIAHPLALNPEDPFDATKDFDQDTLSNKFECSYIDGMCYSGTNPESADTDDDGFNDNIEIEAGTDPCDPDSKPSNPLGLILLLLGLLILIVATNWWIYKKYYLPLTAPKIAPRPQRPQQRPQPQRPTVQRRAPLHLHHVPKKKKPSEKLSRDKFLEEQRKKREQRERMLDPFGAIKHKPRRVMEDIAKKHAKEAKKKEKYVATGPKPKKAEKKKKEEPKKPKGVDHVDKLSNLVGSDSFNKLSKLSSTEADEFEKLAKIVKKKTEKKLGSNQVDKLTKITKKIGEDKGKMDKMEKAIKKTDVDKLDELPTKKADLDKFLAEHDKKKPAVDDIDVLSAGEEEKDVFDSLESMSKKTDVKASTAEKIAELGSIGSKKELEKVIKTISKDVGVDKNVFQVLLGYLLKSGKITKHDVSEIMFDLQDQGILSKKDVADVIFNLNEK